MTRLTTAGMTAATLLLSLAGAGWAQQDSTLIGAARPTATLNTLDSTVGVADVFIGRNTVGPYILSWRAIEAGTEAVTRGTDLLHSGIDYKLDAATGVLTFTAPLRNRDIARVDYRYMPGKAAANAGNLAAPVQFDLFSRGNGALNFSAIYKPEPLGPGAAQPQTAGTMLLGFNGNTSLGTSSSLTSRLFLDTRGGSLLDRSGMQLADKTKTSIGQFSAGYTRAGAGFQGADDMKIAAGRELIEASGALNPIHGIAASATFQQATDLPETGKGTRVTTLGQKLAGTLGLTTRFTATRTEALTDMPDGTSASRVNTRLQIDQRLSANTQATALIDHTMNASGGSSAVLQTNSLSVRSQPSEAVSVTGSFQNKLLATGAEDNANVKVEAAATKQLKLSAAVGERYNQSSALHSREAQLDYSPTKCISLGTSLKLSSEAGAENVATGFSATVKPMTFLELGGGVKMREATKDGVADPTVPDSYNVKLSFGLPKNALKLTGAFTSNPEDEHGTISRSRAGQVGLQSTLGQFDIAGGYQLQEDLLTPHINTVIDVKLGWRITRATQISTAYHEVQAQDTGLLLTDTYSVSLAHRLGSAFDLSLNGAMTQQTRDGVALDLPDYRADLKLGLRF